MTDEPASAHRPPCGPAEISAAASGKPLADAPRPRPSRRVVVALFARALALCYAAALASFYVQAPGLIGERGILPVDRFLAAERAQGNGWLQVPTLLWLWPHDEGLPLISLAGFLAAGALFVGVAPAIAVGIMWLVYLSVIEAGQEFMAYQWDVLLCETLFWSILLVPWRWRWRLEVEPHPCAVWILRWLALRLMLESGAVKLLSGDPNWRGLTALSCHYETQPLPNPLSWWMHHLPSTWHRIETAATLAVELGGPFLVLGGSWGRAIAFVLFALLQLFIAATGNYGFFNVLTVIVCFLLLDDTHLRCGCRSLSRGLSLGEWPGKRLAALVGAVFVGVASTVQFMTLLRPLWWPGWKPPAPARLIFVLAERYHLVATYGLFAVMTTERPELEIEASQDGQSWLPYVFRYKPGPLSRRPPLVPLHMPRLDWQMWFAALTPFPPPWFRLLLERLASNEPAVTSLLQKNPFPEKRPRYFRVLRYRYRFTSPEEKRRTGNWWKRELQDVYYFRQFPFEPAEPRAIP
jgi:hypothetical protein